jgi:putative molybdopterin biosynthesis protein
MTWPQRVRFRARAPWASCCSHGRSGSLAGSQCIGPARWATPQRQAVVMGSHDPLLDWALRESRCGLATAFDSSIDGVSRFAAGECVMAGLHVPGDDEDSWNTQAVAERAGATGAVLVEWAWRERGLVTMPGRGISGLADLAGKTLAPRQPEAGSQILLNRLLAVAGLNSDAFSVCHGGAQ